MYSMESKKHTSLSIPLFAEAVRCGFPSPAADYREEGLDFNQFLVRNKSATYCLRVSGHSMEGKGISPGDILVVDRSLPPAEGDVIVAAVDENFTVKTLIRHKGGVLLRAAHPEYEDIELKGEEELLCFGVVTFCIKPFRGTGRRDER
jgi:DNA polymerase V